MIPGFFYKNDREEEKVDVVSSAHWLHLGFFSLFLSIEVG